MARRSRARRREPAPGGAREVGATLRERRERLGLSPEQAAQAIRVSARHVLAVEEARLDELPPRPYLRGVVAAYAALVDLEPEVADDYVRDAPAPAAQRRRSLFRLPQRDRFNWRNWTFPIACGVAVGAYFVAAAVLAPEPEELPVPRAAPVAEAAGPGAPVAAEDAPAGQPVAQPAGQPAGQPEAAEPAGGQQPAGAPSQEAPAPSIGELTWGTQPQDPPEAAAPAGATGASGSTGAPPPGVRVLLRSEGTTWVEAAPDGGEFKRRELGPGQNLELTARDRLSLAIGDAGVVRVTVGERDLGFIGFKGETKTGISFTRPAAPASPRPPAAAGD